jgi:hypothetical protein
MTISNIYQRFLDARISINDTSKQTAPEFQEANAQMWEAIFDAVRLHRIEGTPIPSEMMFELEFELEHWLAGIPSQRLPLLTRRGRRTSPVVRRCQLTAVTYILASPGITRDKAARQTVRHHFGIARNTLQTWKNTYQEAAMESLRHFYLDLENEQRQSLLTALMKSCGEQYRSLIKAPRPRRATTKS